MKTDPYITVVFDDEAPLLDAVNRIKEAKLQILDVLTPFPVHGLDRALGMKRTRIPGAGFICGVIGGTLGFLFQAWVFAVDYPLVFGGKPYLSVPSFIPVTFELTVLFTALGVASALLIRSGLKPRKVFTPVHQGITDDKFVILVEAVTDYDTLRSRMGSLLAGMPTIEIT